MKRLSPQPVVSVRPPVRSMGARHQGHSGTRTSSPDVTPRHDAPTPATIHAQALACWNSTSPSVCSTPSRSVERKSGGFRSTCPKPLARGGGDRCRVEISRVQSVPPAIGPVICSRRGPTACKPYETSRGVRISYSSPYFSSSLTLSNRGAVSPARHVLTRPRPHPFYRQWGEQSPPVRVRAGTRWRSRRPGDVEYIRGISRHGCQPWSQTCGIAARDAAAPFHSPAPWQSRGRVGMLSCRARIPRVVS